MILGASCFHLGLSLLHEQSNQMCLFEGSAPSFSKSFRYLNEGTEPCKAILGVGFPLHKPYIQLV